MAITDNYEPVKLSGDGVTVAFSFDFRIFENTDVKVSWIDKDTEEVIAVKVLGSDYSVAINPITTAGGVVTFEATDVPDSDTWVLMESNLVYQQPTVFGVDSKLSEKSVEKALDRQARLSQQLFDLSERSIKLPASLAGEGISVLLPVPAAGKLFGWNDDATALVEYDNPDDSVVAAAASAAAALVSQNAASSSASSASTSASTASTQAGIATTQASAAAVSAAAALVSENNAETAETNAELAETNAEAAQVAAEAAQVAAELAETNAETAEANAETAETNAEAARDAALAAQTAAETAETNAETAEANAALSAAKLQGTSVTSNSIATGSKSFTTQAGKFFEVGRFVNIVSDAAPTVDYMNGQVTAYDSGTGALTVLVSDIGGSGTKTDWTIRVSGKTGATGATGSTGATGANGASIVNKIINGAFNVWQRGATFTGITTAYCADMWKMASGSDAVVDVLRSTDVPTPTEAGINAQYSLHVDVTTADATIAAGQSHQIQCRIEGNNIRSLGFGVSGTRYATLSFWVKATKTGTYCVAFGNSAANRSYVAEYTVNVSDTWEKKTITIPIDTTGTWLYDNGIGLIMYFMLACGSTFQTTAGSWQAGVYLATASQVNALDSTSNNFRLALVQLEAGSTAGAFEDRSYEEELALCYRYLRIASFYVPGTIAQNLGIIDMRATPTISGGGAGFTSTGTSKDVLMAYQTAGATASLTLTIEM